MRLRRAVLIPASAAFLALSSCRSDDVAPHARAVPHPLEGYWELRMVRTLWWPRLVPGSLAVWRGPKGLRGSVTFDSMWGFDPRSVTVDPADGERVRFTVDLGDGHVPVEGLVKDGMFEGTATWQVPTGLKSGPDVSSVRAERVVATRRFDAGAACDAFPREDDPSKLGLDPSALDRLITYAGRSETDALVVVKDGKLVCDRRYLRPDSLCELSWITVGISSLAIPLLMEEGKIPRDLDTPLATWFPQWRGDERKSKITLRHVLTCSTGLASDAENAMVQADDQVEFALRSACPWVPGAGITYGHPAAQLLSGVVAKAAGKQIDAYLATRVFEPIGMTKWLWAADGAGNVTTYSGLQTSAEDLARIGRLIARRGRWGEKQVVPAWWFDEVATPSAASEEQGLSCGLLRFDEDEKVVQTKERLDRLRAAGCPDADRLAPLVGRTFEGRHAWWMAVVALFDGDEQRARGLYRYIPWPGVGGEIQGPVAALLHRGSLGQTLLVLPEADLVVVRLRRGLAEDELSADAKTRAGFREITKLALDLVPR